MKRTASTLELMESLLKLNNELLDQQEPFDISASNFVSICRFTDQLIRRDGQELKLNSNHLLWYKQSIKFTTLLIAGIDKDFPQEAILYCINNIFQMKNMNQPDCSLRGVIEDSIFTLYKFLKADYQKIFLNDLVMALANLSVRNNFISLNASSNEVLLHSDESESYTIKSKYFKMNPRQFEELTLWILNFLLQNLISPESTLTSINVHRSWMSALKIIAKNSQNENLLHSAFCLIYRLLVRNCYDPMFAIILLDLILCKEEERFAKRALPNQLTVYELPMTSKVDTVSWTCLKTVALYVTNANVSKSLSIRGLRCSFYFQIMRRAMRLLDSYSHLPPADLCRLANFVLNSLPAVNLVLKDASLHDILSELVADILRYGRHFFDISFEWKSFASLSSFFHILIVTRDDEEVLNYIRQIMSPADVSRSTPMTPEFYNRRWFPCLVCTLFCLSANRDYCLKIIEKLFIMKKNNVKFSFTETIRERFLGILLEFRRSIVDNDILQRCRDRSSVIVKSLGVLMENLDNEFFNWISPKLLVVLKGTILTKEMCIPTWEIFLRKLSHSQMLLLMPQILVAIVPLLSCSAAKTLLKHIFLEREADLISISSDKLFNILLVMSNNDYTKLLDEYIPDKLKEEETSVILESCASMLLTEGVETYQMILTRILGFVNDTEIDSKTTSKLNKALLNALRKADQPEVRDLIARCLGSIGAINPLNTVLTCVENLNLKSVQLVYVDNRYEFYKLFLERFANWYADCTDSEAVDQLSNCILSNVDKIMGVKELGKKVWDDLDVSARREIEPLKANSLLNITQSELTYTYELPIIKNTRSLQTWIRMLYYHAAKEIVDKTLKKLFLSVLHVKDSGAMNFMSEMLPQILIQALVEKNNTLINDFRNEAICVFRMVLNSSEEWIGLANQTVFSILDCLEKFSFNRLKHLPDNDVIFKQVCNLLRNILSENLFAEGENGSVNAGIPLCVLAAEKCNCFFRAVRWLEQYGIKRVEASQNPLDCIFSIASNFQHELFYHLERLYMNLDDMDGVLGAYITIQNNATPTPIEQILALEATGNYSDAMPLCQTIKGQEITLIKCLLRLNQPYQARNNVEYLLKNINNTDYEVDLKYKTTLIDLQMESTCQLGDWEQLKIIQQEYFRIGATASTERAGDNELKVDTQNGVQLPIQPVVHHSWGAQLASIICSLKQFDRKVFEEQVKATRNSLINSVLAMTIESAESYSQIYRYIVRLHALREIEDAKKIFFNKNKISIDLLVEKWEKKSESSNSVSLLEPILAVRRELLRVTDAPGTKEAFCRLLLQSARLSRRAGHLQTAWTFLCGTRATDVKSIEIDMELARYFFQKKDQTQAINTLQNSIEANFPEMSAEFAKALRNNKIGDVNRALFSDFATRKPFIQAYLLLAEFLEKAGANRLDALLCIYQSLEKCGEESEAFLYHYAVFFDRYCEFTKEVDDDMVFNLLKLYGSVLKQGAKYLQHVMPRMLTVWLDWNPKFKKPTSLDAGVKLLRGTQGKTGVRDINAKMREIFNELNHYYFYTCFSQLISRITHTNMTVFKTLKQILSDLIVVYPHQCLWRSIAICRSIHSNLRRERCMEVYELARRRCTTVDLNLLISQYTFLAESFIHIAEDTAKREPAKFSEMFPFVTRFFVDGTMSREAMIAREAASTSGVSVKTGARRSTARGSSGRNSLSVFTGAPKLVLPFFEEIIESNTAHSQSTAGASHAFSGYSNLARHGDFDAMTCYSQVELVDSRQQNTLSTDIVYRFREIYIKNVADEYEVLQSMATPKRMFLIGSDGKRYPLLCKANDELRKDARFMDVNRMLNSLFKRDVEARRRQLFIRCYGVIPLQEAGGIIEWVPNLVTMAGAIRPLIRERTKPMAIAELQRISDSRLSDDERLKNFREILCARTPLVLAEWFRRNFQDAGCWYNARLAFTRTAATMSVVGFIFGLGDRHAENILIDSTTGEVIHVDFNILFNKGEFLRVAELVPFRLTRNMVHAFGLTGVEGTFRRSSENVMRVMRNEQCMLVTVLQAFVHDPLMEWTTAESRNQQSKQFGGSVLQSSECQEAYDTLEMLRLRLAGNIVTTRFQKRKDSLEMSVDGQVAKLIEMAMDEGNLSKMYVGWSAFL